MKKTLLDIGLLVYGAAAYFGYLVVVVFVLKERYDIGLYLFSVPFLYAIFRVLSARIKRASLLTAIYLALPFFVSVYLSLTGRPAVWEITGILPVTVLLSYSLRSEKSSSPLFTRLLFPVWALFFLLVLFLPTVNYLNNRDLPRALQLLLSIYTPAVTLSTLAVFLRFVIETASLNMALNNFRLFIHGARIDRVVFDSADFLSLSQTNLSGIVTGPAMSREQFLKKVDLLNREFVSTEGGVDAMKRDAKFSRTLPDGTELTLAPLALLIREGFLTDDLPPAAEDPKRSYVALAEGRRVIGYYVVDRFDPTANRTMIDVLQEKYTVPVVIVGGEELKKRFPGALIVPRAGDITLDNRDLLVTQEPPENSPAIVMAWGKKNVDAGDIFLADPAMLNIMRLVLVLGGVRGRLYRSIAISSLPFLLPLFLSIYRLHIPQINAVAVLIMILLTMTQTFRSMKADQ